ncbi:hypothetical protein K0M31_002998 [Melipona bicolor]|uniref:Uncharacterized protein n=1 Tax=Melipona bicolor TaxID=60889 RepID=A0AA40G139_9HYME|nr:hypothetical protein K0M31_002998 [Melipona bicolor]
MARQAEIYATSRSNIFKGTVPGTVPGQTVPQYRGICGSTRQQAPLSTYTPYFEDCYDGGKRVARQPARSPDIGLATGAINI